MLFALPLRRVIWMKQERILMKRFMLCTIACLVVTGLTSLTLAQDQGKDKAESQGKNKDQAAVAASIAERGQNGPEQAKQLVKELRTAAEHLVTIFNAGKAAEVAGLFLPEGEWVDDAGNVYQGRKSIEEVLTKYFEKYPGAQIALEIETIRAIGPLAIEEGTRTMSAGEDAQAIIHYVAVLAKTDSGWQYASVKDTAREPIPTAHAALEPLSWMVGDWISEGAEGNVQITYRWSEDGNFLLGDYLIKADGEMVMKSTHRIGWDAQHDQVRSWLFDSDGGFGEGKWTQLSDSWHIHSSATLPDGRAGSAIVTLTPHDGNRFTIRGTERLIGGVKDDDFELTVVRQAPPASQSK